MAKNCWLMARIRLNFIEPSWVVTKDGVLVDGVLVDGVLVAGHENKTLETTDVSDRTDSKDGNDTFIDDSND